VATSPSAEPNPNRNPPSPPAAAGDDGDAAATAAATEGPRPFTALTQEEADLALARVLQEQASDEEISLARPRCCSQGSLAHAIDIMT
jgi:hypothetical protein